MAQNGHHHSRQHSGQQRYRHYTKAAHAAVRQRPHGLLAQGCSRARSPGTHKPLCTSCRRDLRPCQPRLLAPEAAALQAPQVHQQRALWQPARSWQALRLCPRLWHWSSAAAAGSTQHSLPSVHGVQHLAAAQGGITITACGKCACRPCSFRQGTPGPEGCEQPSSAIWHARAAPQLGGQRLTPGRPPAR